MRELVMFEEFCFFVIYGFKYFFDVESVKGVTVDIVLHITVTP